MSLRVPARALVLAIVAGILTPIAVGVVNPPLASAHDGPTSTVFSGLVCDGGSGGAGTIAAQWPPDVTYTTVVWVPAGSRLTVEGEGTTWSGSWVGPSQRTNENVFWGIEELSGTEAPDGYSGDNQPKGYDAHGETVYLDGSPVPQFTQSWPSESTVNDPATYTNGGASRYMRVYTYSSSLGRLAERTVWTLDIEVRNSDGSVADDGLDCAALEASEFFGPNAALRNQCPCRATTGKPIDTFTGNEHFPLPGLSAGGRGHGLNFGLAYNSAAASTDGPTGFGWSSTYDMSLTLNGDGTRTVRQENGATVRFWPDGSGGWDTPARFSATLAQSGGTWTFTRNHFEFFDFDTSGRLAAVRDRNGYSVSVVRNGSGQIDYVEHSDGRRLDFTYTSGRITQIADPLIPTPRTLSFGYDGAGDLVSYTDGDGGVYEMTYTSHKLTTVRTPRHTAAGAPSVIELHYDAQGRADWEEDELDRRTTLYYDDPVANATRRVYADGDQQVDYYTSEGILERTTYGYGTTDATTVEHTYDRATLAPLTKTVDPGGLDLTWAYEYDSVGNQTRATDPDGNSVSATYNSFDQPTTTTDATGVVTTNAYDANGNLEATSTASADPVGTRVVDFVHDPTAPGDIKEVIDARGKTWKLGYDTFGFLNRTENPKGDVTTRENNRVGWVTSTVAPKGNVTGANPADHTTTLTYDGYGQVETTTGPAGTATRQYWAGGLLKQVTDQSNQTTSYGYSAAHELTTVTRPDSSVLATEYWPDGAVKAQIDGASARTEHTYDALGRLETSTDPLNRTTTYAYDRASRMLTKQQPGGNCAATPKSGCVTHEYFPGGGLKKVDYSGTTPDVTYTYDANGRPSTMVDGNATSTWEWDDFGRLKSFAEVTATAGTRTTSYGYGDFGSEPTSITYPGDKTVSRRVDDAGRLDQVTDWASQATTFTYDPNGNIDLTTFPTATGNVDDYGYDNADRMTSVAFKQGTTDLATLSFDRSHPEGFVSDSSGTGVPNAAEAYGYNNLDQLSTRNSSALTYDTADNLTSFAGGPTQRFDAANQLCYQASTNTAACGTAPAGATTFAYDARGNRTVEDDPGGLTASTYGYDQADRMTSATVPKTDGFEGTYNPVPAVRVLTSSTSSGDCTTMDGTPTACDNWAAGEEKRFRVTGSGGVPTSGVSAVVFNVRVYNSAAGGLVKVNRSTDTTNSPAAGTINFAAGEDAHGVMLAEVDADGYVAMWASTAVPLRVDVSGWYAVPDGSTTGSVFYPPDPGPLRLADTDLDYGLCNGVPCSQKLPGSDTPVVIQASGRAGIPSTGVTAVAFNVTAHSGTTGGHLRVARNGTSSTAAGILWWDVTNEKVNDLVIAPLDANGRFTVASNTNVHVTIDVAGYFASPGSTGATVFHPQVPARVMDTRPPPNQTGVCPTATDPNATCTILMDGTYKDVKIAGEGGVPTTGVTAVALNVTANGNGGAGYVKVNKNPGTSLSAAGTLDYDANETVNASVIAELSPTGTISLYGSGSNKHVIIDVAGWYENVGETTTYTYAGDGLRASKTAPDGTVTRFVWDRSSRLPLLLAEDIDAPGTSADKTIRYVYGPDGRVVEDVTSVGAVDTPRWYHHDQLGSTRMLTNSNGAAIGTYGYTPHGTPAGTTGTATTPIGWAGEYRDTETGFVYLRARHYDPSTGQFITRDPIESVTRDAYGYAGNDPVNAIDPLGLNKCEVGLNPLRWGGNAQACADDAWDATGGKAVSFVSDHRSEVAVGALIVAGIACVASVACATAVVGGLNSVSPLAASGLMTLGGTGAWIGTRAPSTEQGKLVADLRSNPGAWKCASAHAEGAVGRAYRGGVSLEEVFERGNHWLVRHSIYDKAGRLAHETVREYGKFGR